MNWLTRIFARGRTAPIDPAFGSHAWPMMYVPTDLRLSTEEMLSTSVVWGAVRAIVDPIASSEVKVYTRDASGGRVYLPDDPAAYLLNTRPNPEFTAQAFKEIVETQTVVHGDGYAEIVFDGSGRVAELWPLQSDAMTPFRDSAGRLWYRYLQPNGEGEVFLEPWRVMHLRGPSIRGLCGDSLIYRASKAIALHVAQEKFATTYFANGTVLGGFVKFPSGITPDTKERLREDFKKRFGGHKKAHGIAFLEAGMEYQAIGANAGESQLVPSRTFSVEEISRYFGVPLVRLGVQAAAQGYGTNVAQLNLQFVRDTLKPWINRFCQEATYKLFPQRAPWRKIEIDTTDLTRGDDVQRAQAREIDIRSGVLSVNEGREQEGKNSIGPAGDLHLVQNNLVVLDEENLQKPEPTPQEPRSPPALPPGGEGRYGQEEMDAYLHAGLSLALDNHRRRWVARARDVDEAKLPEARAELRGKLAADLGVFGKRITDEQFAALATQIESGDEPARAVAHLLGGA